MNTFRFLPLQGGRPEEGLAVVGNLVGTLSSTVRSKLGEPLGRELACMMPAVTPDTCAIPGDKVNRFPSLYLFQ